MVVDCVPDSTRCTLRKKQNPPSHKQNVRCVKRYRINVVDILDVYPACGRVNVKTASTRVQPQGVRYLK